MAALKEIVRGRRSVRTFDGNPVSQEDREKLCEYISGITNPFGIPVEFVLLDAAEYGLSSPVISGGALCMVTGHRDDLDRRHHEAGTF